MRWRKKPPAEPVTPDEPLMSYETRRAKLAMVRAGRDLAELRRQAPAIARSGEELEELNRHNGFFMLVRRALESSP